MDQATYASNEPVKNARKPDYSECLGYLKDKAVGIHLGLVGVAQVNASSRIDISFMRRL